MGRNLKTHGATIPEFEAENDKIPAKSSTNRYDISKFLNNLGLQHESELYNKKVHNTTTASCKA